MSETVIAVAIPLVLDSLIPLVIIVGMSAAATRFGEWLDWLGLPQREVAARIGCAQSFISQIRSGKKRPGREHSQNIETASAQWPQGPIRATEWNAIELKQKASAGSRKRAA